MLQRLARAEREQEAERWLLEHYFQGWAEADPVKIVEATAPNYLFDDPLVGLFARESLARYFERLRKTFARAGVVERQDLAFVLHGPMAAEAGKLQFWREAPRIGLTGTAQIVVGPYGVVADRVEYDPNLASDLLSRA